MLKCGFIAALGYHYAVSRIANTFSLFHIPFVLSQQICSENTFSTSVLADKQNVCQLLFYRNVIFILFNFEYLARKKKIKIFVVPAVECVFFLL